MKKNYLIFILVLFFACNKNRNYTESDENHSDSLDIYIKLLEESKLSNEKKKPIIDKSIFILSSSNNSTKKREALFKIALQLYNQKEWKDYLKVSKILIQNSLEAKDSINIAKAYRYNAGYYKNNQIFDSSFYFYVKAEKIYKNLNDNENYGNILFNKGIVQSSVNNFLGADLSFSKAYNIFKLSEDKQKVYEILIMIGLVSNELKDYDKAIENYNYALELVKNPNFDKSDHQEEICLNNLGYVYQNLKLYSTAIKYYNKALKNNLVKQNDPDLYALLLDNLAYSKLKSNDYKQLPEMFNKSLIIRDSMDNKTLMILSNIHLSEYYYEIKDSVKAIQFSNKSLLIARISKKPIDIIAALKQSSIVDKKNSSKYSDEYIKVTDSLQVAERNSKDRFARIELETDELRQENTQLSEQNRDILNYFAIAIVFGGFLFFARFQRLRARELALKQTQQQANEEIYRLIISHQNQLEEGRDLEKRRISKELHDGVLGRLFGLRLNLDGLNNFDDQETKQQRLDYLNELKIIEQDLREISHELSRENLVLINNFVAIINNLLEQQSKINNAKINTLISDKIDWEKVSNTIKINLYRILQESLQNINKHAEAKSINIIFNKDPKGNLIFSVEDDGKGYNTNGKKTKGIGVNNIVERVHQCQGKIDIKSQIGKGTKIIITFPLENETINM